MKESMKKLVCMLLAIMMAVCLVACGEEKAEGGEGATSSEQSSEDVKKTEEDKKDDDKKEDDKKDDGKKEDDKKDEKSDLKKNSTSKTDEELVCETVEAFYKGLFSLDGSAAKYVEGKDAKKTAEKLTKENLEKELADEFGDEYGIVGKAFGEDASELMIEAVLSMFDTAEVVVDGATVKGDTAIADITVKVPDAEVIETLFEMDVEELAKYIPEDKLVKFLKDITGKSEDEMVDVLVEFLDENITQITENIIEDAAIKEKKNKAELEKVNGEWLIVNMDKDPFDAFFD